MLVNERLARRDGREAEGAPLLREYTGDGIEGSNPSLSEDAPVAQLDRVHGYEPWGQGFESLSAHKAHCESSVLFAL